jgi:hypothetical protein
MMARWAILLRYAIAAQQTGVSFITGVVPVTGDAYGGATVSG